MIVEQLVKRFHPSDDPHESWYAGTGEDWVSDAGEAIGPASALYLSAVYACVRILSESVASLPLKVYRRRADGGKDLAYDHPLYRLLHDEPNSEMTAFAWRETGQSHLALWGNSYNQIVFTKGGAVTEIWPLRPDRMSVERGKNLAIQYVYTKDDGTTRTFKAEEMLHIPGLGFNGLIGYSPIGLARNSLGLARATERFGSKLFANGAMPKVVLTTPPGLKIGDKAMKNLIEGWETNYQGVLKSHKTAVLEDGMDIKTIGVPPEDAQFLETRKFQLQEIARIFRVPPHMLADLDKATFSNIEHMSIEFVVHVLRPWLVRWEQNIKRKLFTEAERKQGYFVEHLVDGLLRGDLKSRYESYAVARNGGWFSVNDIRGFENMNPIDEGDVYLQPLNMAKAGEDVSDTRAAELMRLLEVFERRNVSATRAAEPIEGENERLASIVGSFRAVLRNEFERACKRERQDVSRLLEKGQDLGGYYQQHMNWMVEQANPLARALAIALSKDGRLSGLQMDAIGVACRTVVHKHVSRDMGADAWDSWDGVPDGLATQLVDEILEVM